MDDLLFSLEDLGYNEYFETGRKSLGYLGNPVARVLAEYREAYRVKSLHGEYLAKITGKHMFSASRREDYPAVGDWVAIDELTHGSAIIRGILPRKTLLEKKYSNKQETQIIATNIDIAFIVESMDRDYNLNRFERYLVLIKEGKIEPIIVLNKVDLISKSEIELRVTQLQNRFSGITIILTSILEKHGLNELRKHIMKGKTYCFLGSSGVGKSSIINTLLGKEEIETREISMSLQRGKHTTTTREMYFLERGGILIDNPGIREVGLVSADEGMGDVFSEISILSSDCKFSDCSHINEPGCAVLKAVSEKVLNTEKYNNYKQLKKESEFYIMTNVEKREKNKKFGKFIKKTLQELKLQ